jgi:archaemetzincin
MPRGTVNSKTSKNRSLDEDFEASTFPAPLVLLQDDLAWDPTYPGQSFRSWSQLKQRNAVTSERRIVYFTGPPRVEPGLDYIQKWSQPRVKRGANEKVVGFPDTRDVLSYLEAFYHGLSVKMLPSPQLYFTADIDEDSPPSKRGKRSSSKVADTKSQTLWLNTHKSSGCIGIRSRATPKGDFTHQLNLNDLLDAAIGILPDDAYALLMLVEHDIYEDEDDDFACGRAYGGSRIAVVSGARYNPILDRTQRVERDHAWPVSHCEKYVQSCCEAAGNDPDDDKTMEDAQVDDDLAVDSTTFNDRVVTPMHAALSAHVSLPSLDSSPSVAALSGLWLGRVCRTASHELGHCFGIDHCVYYACTMQGTASVIEDGRQPPYLCPIDLTKILKATGADKNERYRALLVFCEHNKEAHLFAAYAAWIRARLS